MGQQVLLITLNNIFYHINRIYHIGFKEMEQVL